VEHFSARNRLLVKCRARHRDDFSGSQLIFGSTAVEAIDSTLGGLIDWVRNQPGVALLLAVLLQTIALVFGIAGWSRSRHLARRQARMLRGVAGDSLERMLLDYAAGSEDIRNRLAAVERTAASNRDDLRSALRRVGIVRYDAFDQVGGQQSFSLALLDDQSHGIVVTALVARSDSRVYAKVLAPGGPEQRLTPEEARAVSEATLLEPAQGSR